MNDARAAFVAAERLGNREAISGKGCLDLLMGDFERGWEGYEARWIAGKSLTEALGADIRHGRVLNRLGERVLVLNDHGLGDTIQFFRYLPMMTSGRRTVTFVCPPGCIAFSALIRSAPCRKAPEEEDFHAQIAISSLPRAFGTRLETTPAPVPYLQAEPELRRKWAARLGESGFKVGIVWQGNPNPEADITRSIPLTEFAPLATAAECPPDFAAEGFRGSSNSKALAGQDRAWKLSVTTSMPDPTPSSMRQPSWLASIWSLPATPRLRIWPARLRVRSGWPLKTTRNGDGFAIAQDSPWYPTMRLFRQPTIGDWPGVFAQIAQALAWSASYGMRRFG